MLANDVLIIQADADTTYSAGYVHVVRDAIANEGSPGCIAQARTAWPSGFEADYPNVFGAVEAIDQPIRGQFGRHPDDVLVDDKACSYMLGDYLKWGGHRREYFASGEEVLAETTRLLIAARAQGGSRTDLLAATATHSQRRMLEDAAQLLAAAGFPYSQRRMFAADPHLPLGTLEARLRAGDDRAFKRIGEVRAAYLTALTVVLPAHLARTLQGPDPDSVAATRMAGALPVRTSLEAAERPSRLLEDVLTPVWQKEFDTCLA